MKQNKRQDEDRRQAKPPTPPRAMTCSREWIAAEREGRRLRKHRPPVTGPKLPNVGPQGWDSVEAGPEQGVTGEQLVGE